MVARGDLGVEVALETVPRIQKSTILRARHHGKFVVTATQMLESMIDDPMPTRAEVSDVANAIYEGTNAIMLSAESPVGKYPVEAVKFMARIATETENSIRSQGFRKLPASPISPMRRSSPMPPITRRRAPTSWPSWCSPPPDRAHGWSRATGRPYASMP